jgi:hypothetical protein
VEAVHTSSLISVSGAVSLFQAGANFGFGGFILPLEPVLIQTPQTRHYNPGQP